MMFKRKSVMAAMLMALAIMCSILGGCGEEAATPEKKAEKAVAEMTEYTVQGVDTSIVIKSPFEPKAAKTPPPAGPNRQFIKKQLATDGNNKKVQLITATIVYDKAKVEKATGAAFSVDLNQQVNSVRDNIGKKYKNASEVEVTDVEVSGNPGKLMKFQYDSKNGTRLDSRIMYFMKDAEQWTIQLNAQADDEESKATADAMLASVK